MSQTDLSRLNRPGFLVLDVLPLLSCSGCPIRLSPCSCLGSLVSAVPVALTQFSFFGRLATFFCPSLAQLPFLLMWSGHPVLSVLTVLYRMSFPGCPVQAALLRLPCPSCPVLASLTIMSFFSRHLCLSCPFCPISLSSVAVESKLPCPRCPIQALMYRFS